MDILTNWEKLLRKTNYNLYKENFSFNDDEISLSTNCNNLESNLGNIRIDISNDEINTIFNIINYTDLKDSDNFVFISLRNDTNYNKKSFILKENLRANIKNINEDAIFIINRDMDKDDIKINGIENKKYFIVPQERANDAILYEALNILRSKRKNNIILLIEEDKDILIKNSNIEEIKKLKSAMNSSISREIKIIGSYEDIVRSLNKILDWDGFYTDLRCLSDEAIYRLKEILIEKDLSKIYDLDLLVDRFTKGEITYNLKPSDKTSILNIKFKRKKLITDSESNNNKNYEDELKEIRENLIKEYKTKKETDYKERAYLIQMIRDLSEILK